MDAPLNTQQLNSINPNTHLGDVSEDYTFNNGVRQSLFLTGPIDFNEKDPNKKWKNVKLKYKHNGGSEDTLEGYKAVLSALDKSGNPLLRTPDRMYQAAHARKPGDVRNSALWNFGKAVQRDMKSLRIHSPFKGTVGKVVTGTALGAGGLALASWLLGKLGLNFMNPTAGAVVGGGLGGLSAYWLDSLKDKIPYDWYKKQQDLLYGISKKSSVMEKKATLYHDPRNFILEKLQRDTQLSMSDKAMLAGKIRAMSLPEANNLEREVRSALGVGVGALIAKHFGLGPVGALMGGMLGALASNAMGIGHGAFGFADRPSLYNAFNQGGIGFDTYNQFFSLVNKGV